MGGLALLDTGSRFSAGKGLSDDYLLLFPIPFLFVINKKSPARSDCFLMMHVRRESSIAPV